MNSEIIENKRIREQYTRIKHKSGLTICLYPMREYSTAFAIFGAKYGSIDTTFKTKKDADYVAVPEGIAHYLEHKLFENDDCDALEQYAKTGASANAYTTFDSTAYYFSCTREFEENLRILLNFVQNPYFTDESVQKEQGIISQEIKIYLDDPSWRVFFNGLCAVYHYNPVRIDIAGTTESIAKIDKELLYRCYNAFYNLNNMVLSVAGNFDPDDVIRICDELLKTSENQELDIIIPEEPYGVKEKRCVQKLYCAVPLFQLAFKMPNYEGYENTRNFIIYNMLFETALGSSSPFFSRLYESGLINDTFHVGVFNGRGFFLPVADGESRDPDRVTKEIIDELNHLKKTGLPRDEFEIVKKMTYGELIGTFNNVGAVAKSVMQAEFNGLNAYDNVEITASVTYEDITEALQRLDTENYSLSIIEPLDK